MYFCHKCDRYLEETSHFYHCRDCGIRYQVTNGIINFSSEDNYWNQISRSQMSKIISYAKDNGTERALFDLFKQWTSEYHYNYSSNFSRADWHFIMDSNSESVVLDIGPGWGAVTIPLAMNYNRVIAADVNRYTLEFLGLRKNEFKLNNLDIISICPLEKSKIPFADDTFDLIVLNGVLEWFAYFSNKNPREIQMESLKELKRVLKKEGKIYVGVENRYYLGYFFGTKEHGNLPFMSILPRFLSNVITRLVKGSHYKTYLYSKKDYKKLFEDVGLAVKKTYYPLKNYRDVDYIIPSKDRVSFGYYLSTHPLKFKKFILSVMFAMNVHEFFLPAFSFIVGHDR